MIKRIKVILAISMVLAFIVNNEMIFAKASNKIVFKDNNLQSALCKYYEWSGPISEEDASNLSKTNHSMIVFRNLNISDLEGLQYFKNLKIVYIPGNDLENLKPLSKLKSLGGVRR